MFSKNVYTDTTGRLIFCIPCGQERQGEATTLLAHDAYCDNCGKSITREANVTEFLYADNAQRARLIRES